MLLDLSALIVALVTRVFLILQGWDSVLQRRIEVTTPANSFRNVLEGVDMINSGLQPYDGNNCHIQYHILLFVRALLFISPACVPVCFILCDLLTSYLLGVCALRSTVFLAHHYGRLLNSEQLPKGVKRSQDSSLQQMFEQSLPTVGGADKVRRAVMLCYLFNPFTIASCIAYTTTTLDNTLLVLALYVVISANNIGCIRLLMSLTILSFASASTLHLAALVLPIAAWKFVIEDTKYNHQQETQTKQSNNQPKLVRPNVWRVFASVIGAFLCLWATLIGCIRLLYGSWDFMFGTYGFVTDLLLIVHFALPPDPKKNHIFSLSVPDLQPNMGLFWYFFTEVFDHFRLFFTWVFQLNLTVYLIPLAVTIRHDPLLLCFELLVLIATFKPYPSVCDTAVYLAMLPAFQHLYRFLPHTLTTACGFLVSISLAPVMWSLWIDVGSANANFFFAITMFYNTAQIFLLTDFLYAYHGVASACRFGIRPVHVRDEPGADLDSSIDDSDKSEREGRRTAATRYRLLFDKRLFGWSVPVE